MIKVLLLSHYYPLTMSRYFERAFKRRSDVELKTVGPYTGRSIPWPGNVDVPEKYAVPPTIILPTGGPLHSYDYVRSQLGDWEPDLVLSVDAGSRWVRKPATKAPVVHVATDPHVLDYSGPRSYSDFFFNMQLCYSQPGDIYLPYAFSPDVHYVDDTPQTVDCSLIGNYYDNRIAWVNELRKRGHTVNFEIGPMFDEYRVKSRQARVGLNWSSRNDLVARVFEIMAMGLIPVINRVPDLGRFFVEDEDFLGFSNLSEAIQKTEYAISLQTQSYPLSANRKVWEKSENGFPRHSYDERCHAILKTVGLL